MLIEESKLTYWIENFYGYGSWEARIWLIGYEEDGGEVPEDVADRINFFHSSYRAASPTLCDIRELYRSITYRNETSKTELFPTRFEYRFGAGASLNNVWKNLIAFEFGFRDEDEPDFLFYQKNIFAAAEYHNESLIRLFPLPGPRSHAWYYAWLDTPGIKFLKTRTQYERSLYDQRMKVILTNVREHKPEVVLMYGMNNVNALKSTIAKWAGGKDFRLIKGSKMEIPQHHICDVEGTLIVITTQFPALRHNRPETGFNWREFGKKVGSFKSQI